MALLKNFFTSCRRFFVLFKKLPSSFFGFWRQQDKKKDVWQAQSELDKKLVCSLAKSRIPSLSQLKYLNKFLSAKELILIKASFAAIIISLFFWGVLFYKNNLRVVPVKGGEYTEGLVGTPKYINPLYARLSDVDKDLTALIFSSLFKRNQEGKLIPDLAERYEISSDEKSYTIYIREGVKWHNDSELTADDIIFTFNAIKETKYKSPLKSSFGGVEIEKIDDKTIKFILREPYSAFLELLTFGVMPGGIWSQIPPESAHLADLNLKPIGCGPYKFSQLTKDSVSGAIIDYSLKPNENYYQEPALINLKFKFYPSIEEAISALKRNEIDGLGYLPKEMEGYLDGGHSVHFYRLHIPQLTLIYFNPRNNQLLEQKEARLALGMAINRQEIIDKIFDGSAYLVDGPILPDSFAYYDGIKKIENNPQTAASLLDNLGWQIKEIKKVDLEEQIKKIDSDNKEEAAVAKVYLTLGEGKWRVKDKKFFIVKLTTVERAENRLVAEMIKNYWENIGVKTELDFQPASDIQRNVVKTRNFEAFFYGLVVGADPDPYVFWHSSQANENGFNLANFSDKEADQLLEDARIISNIEVRKEKYKRFQEIILEKMPVIFMYSSIYTYPQGKKVKNFKVKNIVLPSDRFADVNKWYINTGRKISW